METIRLRRKRNPNIVCEESVGTCVRARSMVPPDAVQVTSLSELTIPLRRLVHLNALAECAVWRAWSHGGAIYFVTGTTNFELSRASGRPVLQMRVYNREGALEEELTCVQTLSSAWERIDVPERNVAALVASVHRNNAEGEAISPRTA
jgi:hypothetical protein